MNPTEASALYNVSLEIAESALNNIAEGRVIFLTISGKIGAGKDTVAPRVVELLNFKHSVHESFAGPLRQEVNQVIDCIKRAASFDEAMSLVEEELNSVNHFEVVEALYKDVKTGKVKTAFDRTSSSRRALQWWGTEVRRSIDTDYWVKKAMKSSIEKLAAGTSIYVTDSRFPNEAASITQIGGLLVRLLVSPEEQRRRIVSRDGIEPNEAAVSHISETSMDDYDFENIIDTDVYSTEEVIEFACKIANSYLNELRND